MQYLPYKSLVFIDISSHLSIDNAILTNWFSNQFEIHILQFFFIGGPYHCQIGSKDSK